MLKHSANVTELKTLNRMSTLTTMTILAFYGGGTQQTVVNNRQGNGYLGLFESKLKII